MNYTLRVVEIRKETDNSATICFNQPGLKKIKYLAGQYLTLIFRINGRRYIRPYSFSSCYGIDPMLEITVKRVPNGLISNHIIDVLKVNDVVEAMPPMGDFIYHANENITDVFLWGVGSGITPLISIAKYILNSEIPVVVHLIYGNRNTESTIFLKLIKELESKYHQRFRVRHFYTRLVIDKYNPTIIQGRIDQEKAISILTEVSVNNNSVHYICGPSGLKESVKKALKLKQIDDAQIFSEDFELVKDPKDFEDIHTQHILLTFEGITHTLEVTKGKSILEAALDADIELPYSCQTGNCSTCKGVILRGEVKMIGLSDNRDDLMGDEYLLCCTHPLTQNVQIEI